MAINQPMNRRQFMLTTSVVGGAFVLGFVLTATSGRRQCYCRDPVDLSDHGRHRDQCLAGR